jgi:hypothetical protein
VGRKRWILDTLRGLIHGMCYNGLELAWMCTRIPPSDRLATCACHMPHACSNSNHRELEGYTVISKPKESMTCLMWKVHIGVISILFYSCITEMSSYPCRDVYQCQPSRLSYTLVDPIVQAAMLLPTSPQSLPPHRHRQCRPPGSPWPTRVLALAPPGRS